MLRCLLQFWLLLQLFTIRVRTTVVVTVDVFRYAVINVDVNVDVVVNIDLFVFANNDVVHIVVNVCCL